MNPNPTLRYLESKVQGASAVELLLMAYDAALVGCNRRDLELTSQALSVLRQSLDFDKAPEISMGFLRLYQQCSVLIRAGNYEETSRVLRSLRDAWEQATRPA